MIGHYLSNNNVMCYCTRSSRMAVVGKRQQTSILMGSSVISSTKQHNNTRDQSLIIKGKQHGSYFAIDYFILPLFQIISHWVRAFVLQRAK